MSKREKVVSRGRLMRMAERSWDEQNKRANGSMMSWSDLLSGTDHDSDYAVYTYGFIDGYNAARVQPKARKKARKS
jgi:hypothetical protein